MPVNRLRVGDRVRHTDGRLGTVLKAQIKGRVRVHYDGMDDDSDDLCTLNGIPICGDGRVHKET